MTKENLKVEDLCGGTYNQTIKKITRQESGVERIVVRKESNFLNKSLIKEIEFLLSLRKGAGQHFPKINAYRIDKAPVFYEMPYYDMKTMRRSIIEGQIDSKYCMEVMENILNFMFSEIFSQNVELDSDNNFVKRTLLRVRERQEQLCNKSNIIKKFIKAERIIMAGKEYKNIPEIIGFLIEKPGFIKRLTPKVTHMVHGDFHFGNFLIDNKDPDNFILIDPRGEKEGYDYAYDVGKLWHSFHGLYDFINEGLFELEYKADGDLIDIDIFKPKESKALLIYKEIYSKRQKFIDMCSRRMREDNAKLQILFNEAIHFCALAPFHLKNDYIEKEPICRYLMGVKLLNEFMDEIG